MRSEAPSALSHDDIRKAIAEGTQQYFAGCRARVPDFVQQHFFLPGSWYTNRVALGFDLLRAPLNLFWAPLYAFISILRFALTKAGQNKIADLLAHLPAGFTTKVQKRLAEKLYSELLKLDCENSKLETCIVQALKALYCDTHSTIDPALSKRIESLVHEALLQYRVTRTASSDITNTITSTVIGAFAFYKFTPGGIGIGVVLATLFAKYFAVKDFFLGESVGEVYYYLFPPEPSLALTTYSLLAVMILLSIFASFSGMITDPVQALFGLHQKRLYKMLDHLERDFLTEQNLISTYRPKDQYIARLFDMFDVVKSHIH